MSYQLHCPNCSTVIPPENINVQQTIAACVNCGAVFNFADKITNVQKIKRRKIKQPDHITQTETTDSLKLEMPLVQSRSYKFGTLFGGMAILLFYIFILANVLPDGDPSDIVPMVLLGSMFIPFVLGLFGSLFATQSVEINADELKHEVRLGVPVYQRKMNSNDLETMTVEEMTATRESIAEARYNLYAEKYDSRQEMFMQNQPEEMALYTQQVISSYLGAEDDEISPSRLVDEAAEDVVIHDDAQTTSAQSQQHR